MNESEYWSQLEHRISREFKGMSERRLHWYWCDGIFPEACFHRDSRPRILGRAWICNGQAQDEWTFELLLPQQVSLREEIDWGSLLPPENVTRWLAVDQRKKFIQIEPSAAVPDLK